MLVVTEISYMRWTNTMPNDSINCRSSSSFAMVLQGHVNEQPFLSILKNPSIVLSSTSCTQRFNNSMLLYLLPIALATAGVAEKCKIPSTTTIIARGCPDSGCIEVGYMTKTGNRTAEVDCQCLGKNLLETRKPIAGLFPHRLYE